MLERKKLSGDDSRSLFAFKCLLKPGGHTCVYTPVDKPYHRLRALRWRLASSICSQRTSGHYARANLPPLLVFVFVNANMPGFWIIITVCLTVTQHV